MQAIDANDIVDTIPTNFLGDGSRIEVDVKAGPLSISADRAVNFGLIVDKLAANAIEHAFPTGHGRITIGCEGRGEEVVLTIIDDGVGLGGAASQNSSGLGSRFVAPFVKQLGGTIVAAAGQGGGPTFTVRMSRSVLA